MLIVLLDAMACFPSLLTSWVLFDASYHVTHKISLLQAGNYIDDYSDEDNSPPDASVKGASMCERLFHVSR